MNIRSRSKLPEGMTRSDLINKAKKTLECNECGKVVNNVGFDTKSVICWLCVAKHTAPPEFKSVTKTTGEEKDYPRGWWRKKRYVSPSGRIYEMGKEITDEKEKDDTGTD